MTTHFRIKSCKPISGLTIKSVNYFLGRDK